MIVLQIRGIDETDVIFPSTEGLIDPFNYPEKDLKDYKLW